MPPFGMSKAGKDAKGWINESGRWNQEQYKSFLEKSQSAYDRARAISDSVGQGIIDTRNAGTGFLDDPYAEWNQTYGKLATQWGDVANGIRGNIWDQRKVIDDTRGANMGYADEMEARNAQTRADNMGYIGSEYGGLRTQNWNRYNDMMGANEDLYSGLRDEAGNVYTDASRRVEMLNPASEAAQAMVARAYAPQYASTLARLSSAGVNAADPQVQAALARVDTARSRGLDDDLAKRASQYVDTKNQVATQGLNTDLGLAQTGAGIGRDLSTRQLGTNIDLGKGQLAATLGESTRAMTTANAIDANRQGIQNEYSRDFADWTGRLNQSETQAFQTGAEIQKTLAEGKVQQALQKYGIEQQQLANEGNFAQMQYQQAQMFAQLAHQYGADAARDMMQSYQIENASSNWLGKALGGAAMTALNFAMPGVGSALGGIMGGKVTNAMPAGAGIPQDALNGMIGFPR